jgi:hypothetical protein
VPNSVMAIDREGGGGQWPTKKPPSLCAREGGGEKGLTGGAQSTATRRKGLTDGPSCQ